MDKINNYLYIGYYMTYLDDKKNISRINKPFSNTNNNLARDRNFILFELKKSYIEDEKTIIEVSSDFLSLFQKFNSYQLLSWKEIGKEICKLYNNGFILLSDTKENDFINNLNKYFTQKDSFESDINIPKEL